MRSSPEEFQKDFWKNVGQRITVRRKQLGMTRDQLSFIINISERDSASLNAVNTAVASLG